MLKREGSKWIQGFLLGVALSASLYAAGVAPVRQGNTEIGGFIGASYGIDEFRVMGGGNVSYAATRIIMPYAEFSYFPGIGREKSVPGLTNAKYTFGVPLTDFHGGVHIRIPIKESPVVPYLAIGAGAIHALKYNGSVVIPAQSGFSGLTIPISEPARTDFAVNFGGGIRFYVNERFGFRVEAKAYKPSGTYTQVFGKVEGGFFFQLK
jgi:hypothetical protein